MNSMRKLLFYVIQLVVSRFPRSVALISFGLAALAGYYGAQTMEFVTDQDKLLSEDLDYHQRYMDFIRNFGDLEFLYIVIEGPTKDRMIDFADALAGRLQYNQDIKDVIYKFDTGWATDYALYFDEVTLADLRRLDRELAAHRGRIDDLFSTRTLDHILFQIDESIDLELTSDDAGRPFAEGDLATLIDALQGKVDTPFEPITELKEELDKQKTNSFEYNWAGQDKFLIMLVMPDKDFSTLSVIEKPIKEIRAAIRSTKIDFPDVTAGLTGRPALQADEMETTNRDTMNASLIALTGVALLFIVFFRELGRPFCGILSLLCAMGWTYGFVALTLGHLNLLSLVFALILIGLGIDFGIHFLHRYQEELERTGDPAKGIESALAHAGKGILTGALTSSVAFLIAMLTKFLGLAELGFVAGFGIIFCLIAMLVTLPALLIAYDRHFRSGKKLPTPVHLLGLRHVSRYPTIQVAAFVVITVFLVYESFEVGFNDNLLDLQAEGLESVEYEHKLIDESDISTWYCAFIESDLESVRETVALLEAEPTVAGVDSLAEPLPLISQEKQSLIHSIRNQLAFVKDHPNYPYYPNPFIRKSLVEKVDALAAQIDRLDELRALKESIEKRKQEFEVMKEQARMAAERQRRQAQTGQTLQGGNEMGMEALDPAMLERMNLDPSQMEALKNDPDLAARAQSRGGEGTIPPGMDLSTLNPSMPDSGMEEFTFPEIPEIPELSEEQLRQIEQLKRLASLLTGEREAIERRLIEANRALLQEPRDALKTLYELVTQEPPTPEVLPDLFQRMFVGKDGSLLVMAYPKYNIWETEPMKEFVDAMRRIDPEVTGTPIQVYESSQLMRDSFIYVGICSVAAVGVMVFLDFLSITAFLYIMFPLMVGVLWLVGIMGLFDVNLNLANFFAIPILIGIGVDNAVHFYHRYEEDFDVEKSMYTTGTTLTLTTLTTITGFGSLMFASHKGLASLGELMTIGSATCWLTCVVFMPSLIKLLSRR